jgi:dihydrofolate reductase
MTGDNTMSRLFIAALQVSLDGYLQGANGEVDWVDSWDDALGLVPGADTAVLGGGMYPGYQHLWGSVAADPRTGAAMLGREVTEGEADYALWTQRAPHYVLSTTIENVSWETTHLVRDVSELRSLKEQPGGAVYVIGGAKLVASLLNEGLIDEVRLIVHPVILGGGKSPFAGVKKPRTLQLAQTSASRNGRVILMYRV